MNGNCCQFAVIFETFIILNRILYFVLLSSYLQVSNAYDFCLIDQNGIGIINSKQNINIGINSTGY